MIFRKGKRIMLSEQGKKSELKVYTHMYRAYADKHPDTRKFFHKRTWLYFKQKEIA